MRDTSIIRLAMPMSSAFSQVSHAAADARRVDTAHSFTGRMCAASRWDESQRADALFTDRLGAKLAGSEGRAQPMGGWIMVPRTRYGDDLLSQYYEKGCRQLVLLGAGMDARAYRMSGLPQLRVFEVDQATTFDVKEPLLESEPLSVQSRAVVATEFTERGRWATDLEAAGFDKSVPTVWLLEGLLMYLSMVSPHDSTRTRVNASAARSRSAVPTFRWATNAAAASPAHLSVPLDAIPLRWLRWQGDTVDLMSQIGRLSPRGSVVFHDAVSANYVNLGVVVRCAHLANAAPASPAARVSFSVSPALRGRIVERRSAPPDARVSFGRDAGGRCQVHRRLRRLQRPLGPARRLWPLLRAQFRVCAGEPRQAATRH